MTLKFRDIVFLILSTFLVIFLCFLLESIFSFQSSVTDVTHGGAAVEGFIFFGLPIGVLLFAIWGGARSSVVKRLKESGSTSPANIAERLFIMLLQIGIWLPFILLALIVLLLVIKVL